MHVPDDDITESIRLGLTFKVAQKPGRHERWESVRSGIASPAESVEYARQVSAWEVAVFTSEGFQYWSSRHPECFNSPVIRCGKMSTHTLPCFERIHWRALLRTQPRKVERFVQSFGKALGTETRLERSRPYWKDRSLVDVEFSSRLDAPDIREATFQALLQCQQLLPDWSVTGPTQYAEERWEFYGMARDEARGLVMVEFWVRNFVQEWSGTSEEEDS
jgi:hypothetical protein